MIPLWMWVRVEEPGRKRFALPIPLFLVWLLLVALLLLLLPLVLLAALLAWPSGWGAPLLKMYFQLFVLVGSLSGLVIDVSGKKDGKITRILLK
jgi:hypothetical protein